MTRDFLGAGLRAPDPGVRGRAARRAGDVGLDPVYTAKAMAAALAFEGDGPLLFLHTHGPR